MSLDMSLSRRGLFRAGIGGGVSAAALAAAPAAQLTPKPAGATPETLARDEAYWARVRSFYGVTDAITNLENGYWGIMARPVLAAYQAHTARINRDNTAYARRREYGADMGAIMARLAAHLGVARDELLLTRGASEALQNLIGGYNRLRPGDAVLYADLDYAAMKSAMRWLKDRRGVDVIKIDLPEPATYENILDAYQTAFASRPNIRMILLTHLNNLTGLIHPVREIAAMARERDIDVILDSAHALGQIDFRLADLGCDFVGLNLHKWIGAPIGCGLIYIRRDRIPDIDRYMGEPGDEDDISARAHTGTANFAAYLTIPQALDFHEAIGSAAKEARLRYLRNLWVSAAREIPHIDILTPDDPRMVAALTSFRAHGHLSTEENNEIVRELATRRGILTVRRSGPAAGDCVRVTPSIYNAPEEVLKLPPALAALQA